MKIILKQNVPASQIRFVVPRSRGDIKLSQNNEFTVVQDLGQDATEILIQTSDNPQDNAWIPIECVHFPEL
jgi:hypothetical protein